MFVLDDKASTYWFPVKVEMISDEGRKQTFTFGAEFERISQEEITDLFRKREDDEPKLKDDELIERVFRGWRDIQTPDGHMLEVTPENRARLLSRFPVPKSIVTAYLKSIGIEGQRKN